MKRDLATNFNVWGNVFFCSHHIWLHFLIFWTPLGGRGCYVDAEEKFVLGLNIVREICQNNQRWQYIYISITQWHRWFWALMLHFIWVEFYFGVLRVIAAAACLWSFFLSVSCQLVSHFPVSHLQSRLPLYVFATPTYHIPHTASALRNDRDWSTHFTREL